MSNPNEPDSAISGQPQSTQTTPVQANTPAIPPDEAPPLNRQPESLSVFSSVHAAIANIREDARAKARQMIAEAEHALLESLRALHASDKSSPTDHDADPTSKERGQS